MMELNKDILIQALKKLPTHSPGEHVWKSVSESIDQYSIEKPLYEAIDQLPSYIPGKSVWDHVEIDLELIEEGSAKENLPQHTPPDIVWDKIESELPTNVVVEKKATPGFRRMYISVASAAAVALLFATTLMLFPTDELQIAYTEEWVEETGDDFWESTEPDEAFEVLTAICADQPPVCSDSEFQDLQKELDFMNESLIAELTEMEIERNEIVKEMIDKIL